MAPPFRIPLGSPLQSPLVSWPSSILDEPPGTEGRLVVPFTIAWSEYPAQAGSTPCVMVDIGQAQGPQKISVIAAAWVDNSQSDADVFLLFNDMGTSIEIPARTTQLVPVSTRGLQFAVSSPQAAATDQVNLEIFNFNPHWLSILPPYLVTADASASQTLSGLPSATQIIAAGTNGILTGLTITADTVVPGAANGTAIIQIQDGEAVPVLLWSGRVGFMTGISVGFVPVLNLTGQNLRFKNGLSANVSFAGTVPTSGSFLYTAYFR